MENPGDSLDPVDSTERHIMAKIISLFGSGGTDGFSFETLGAARSLIASAFQNGRDDFITPLRKILAKHPDIAAAFAWLHVHEHRDVDDKAAMVMLAALLDGPMFSPAQRQRSAKAYQTPRSRSVNYCLPKASFRTRKTPPTLLSPVNRPVNFWPSATAWRRSIPSAQRLWPPP